MFKIKIKMAEKTATLNYDKHCKINQTIHATILLKKLLKYSNLRLFKTILFVKHKEISRY